MLRDVRGIPGVESPQSIITVANDQAQKEIREFLESLGHQSARDYFFFC